MKNIIEIENKYHMQTYNRFPVVMTKGSAQYLFDEKGKKYLDFISGLGVVNVGHSNSVVSKAICNQASKLIHTSNLFYTENQALLAEKLVELSFGKGKVFFGNSGAEANEAAVKLTRRWAKIKGIQKPQIITAINSFHGRTLKMLAATGQKDKQKPFEPLPPGFKHVKFNDIEALNKAINQNTAAVMLEVIQGEGGVFPADKNYLKEVAKICKEKNMLLIFDEVQTGLCRTGKFFAYQNYGIKPDIITAAKALGNGIPIGVAIATEKIAEAFNKGDHGSTFGGNPLACSAALAVIKVMQSKKLDEKSANLGIYLKNIIEDKLSEHIVEIRGIGLMLGFNLKKSIAPKVTKNALEKGLIINNIGKYTIRLLPPLIITKNDCNEAINIIKEVLDDLDDK